MTIAIEITFLIVVFSLDTPVNKNQYRALIFTQEHRMVKIGESFNESLALTDFEETVFSLNEVLNMLNGLLNV